MSVSLVLSEEIGVFNTEMENLAKRVKIPKKECFSPFFEGVAWGLDLLHKAETQIKPALERGELVLLDRYALCNLVFTQLSGVNTFINQAIHRLLPKPDLMIYLSIDWQTSWQRIINRNKEITMKEQPESLKAALELYKNYLAQSNVNVVEFDANLSIPSLRNEAVRLIDSLLKKNDKEASGITKKAGVLINE